MMKKTILLLLAAFCGVLTVAAQDLIIKADASKVEAKVTEITPESVRYKRFSNPDGPTYVLPVSEISYIQYANGEKEYFKAAASIPATPLTPAIPAEEPAKVSAAPAAAEAPAASPADGVKYVVKEYEIGEFYNQDGIKGVVCMLSDDRQHGLVISLDEIYLHWSEFRKPDLRVIGTDNRSDGSVNMEKVAAYIAENNLSWDDFPAFKWCREKGEGWYLPSIDELLNIGHNYSGGTRVQSSRQARNRFNNALKNNGGKRMDRLVYYFSSTEKDEKSAFTSHMGIEPPYVVEIPKYNNFLVRAAQLTKAGLKVWIGAADTFRAAAIDQLKVWADRAGATMIRQEMGSDPASVAFDTLTSAKANGADVVLIDTAGRLHNKVNLMNELTKIRNVMGKVIPGAPHEVMLVLDGSTGQNAFEQARQFTQATQVTSLTITKLDGTAKGGVVIGISDQFHIPVRYIGIGEGIDQLRIFDRREFVNALFGHETK